MPRSREILEYATNFQNYVKAKGAPWDAHYDDMLGVIFAGCAGCSPEGLVWITPQGELELAVEGNQKETARTRNSMFSIGYHARF